MAAISEELSKITSRYQTTVPSRVRKQLKLGKGDQIRYRAEPGGRIYIKPVRASEDEPGLRAFVDSIEADIRTHPERLQVFNGGLYDRLKALIGEVAVDLDKPLSSDDE